MSTVTAANQSLLAFRRNLDNSLIDVIRNLKAEILANQSALASIANEFQNIPLVKDNLIEYLDGTKKFEAPFEARKKSIHRIELDLTATPESIPAKSSKRIHFGPARSIPRLKVEYENGETDILSDNPSRMRLAKLMQEFPADVPEIKFSEKTMTINVFHPRAANSPFRISNSKKLRVVSISATLAR